MVTNSISSGHNYYAKHISLDKSMNLPNPSNIGRI